MNAKNMPAPEKTVSDPLELALVISCYVVAGNPGPLEGQQELSDCTRSMRLGVHINRTPKPAPEQSKVSSGFTVLVVQWHTPFVSKHSAGRGKDVFVSSRLAWPTKWVLGQTG